MTWLIFVASVIAVFRISTTFSLESGPGRIFKKLRNVPDAKSSAKEGLSCPLCLGVWFSAIVTAFLWWKETIELSWTPLWWLAISGGAVLLTPLHVLILKK